jgi:glycerophosphoryl diester phosphodiesterase
MRKTAAGLSKAFVALAAFGAPTSPECRAETEPRVDEAVVVGHRGLGRAHESEPENDPATLVRALEAGASAVEFDVQLARDGEVVLAHDERLERSTNGMGCVASFDAPALAALRLQDGSGRVHADRGVATLQQALAAIRPFRRAGAFVADVHVKVFDQMHGDWPSLPECPRTNFRRLTDRVLETIHDLGVEDSVMISSFDPRVLERVRTASSSIPVALISYLSTRVAIDRASRSGFDAVVAADRFLDADDVTAAHHRGLRLFVWFPDHESLQRDEALLARTDGLISDHPQAAALLRREINRGSLD